MSRQRGPAASRSRRAGSARRPAVIVVAPPRSGAGLVAAVLASAPGWGTSGLTNVDVEERAPRLAAAAREHASHRLRAADAAKSSLDAIRRLAAEGEAAVCSVDWNPKLSLRIGLVAAALPDARFVVVSRRFEPAVASLTAAWQSRCHVTEPDLPGWWGEPWSFPLVDGWRDLVGKSLTVVSASQWAAIADAIREDLGELPRNRWAVVSFEAFLEDPSAELAATSAALGLDWQGEPPAELPRHEPATLPAAMGAVLMELAQAPPAVASSAAGYRDFLESARPGLPWPEPARQPANSPTARSMESTGTPFAYSHSQSLCELLEKAGSSLAITTYKTGHVLLARSAGGRLNTEVKSITRAMGVAATGQRLAIGAAETILSYAANKAVAAAVGGPVAVDTAYLPRSVVHTGDVLVHELAHGGDGLLYFVNTRFSCLCRLDLDHSFVPVWRPPWVSALAAEDRCHLNGLAMVDGRPRYVTALAETDTPAGWRDHKGSAGVLVELPEGRVVAGGLAMPHSPRWHRNRLWVLESGRGTLATVDPASGRVETVATLPGFTRGLAFIGRYALVGLSQVRESVFAELPITSGTNERICGVSVVDTETGMVLGGLRFSAAVQEIFDVAVLPFAWPTIVEPGTITANTFVIPDRNLPEVATRAADL